MYISSLKKSREIKAKQKASAKSEERKCWKKDWN